jgi:hypothetical protein
MATAIKNRGMPNTYSNTGALSVSIPIAPVSAPVNTAVGIAKVVVAVCFFITLKIYDLLESCWLYIADSFDPIKDHSNGKSKNQQHKYPHFNSA